MVRSLTVRELTAAVWTPTAICILITLGRFYIRWNNRRLRWDDFLNGVALAFLLAYSGTWQKIGPWEYHVNLFEKGVLAEPPANMLDVSVLIDYNIVKTNMFWCTIYAVKASLLALYWNIFKMSPNFRLAWYFAAAYTVVAFFITFAWQFWECGSPKDYMVAEICRVNATEAFFKGMFIGWCVLDIVGDLILLALPFVMLSNMLAGTRRKIELGVIFGLVLFNIVFELMRTVYGVTGDATNYLDQYDMWCAFQVNTAVIVCALPCYGGLMRSKSKAGDTGKLNVVTATSPSGLESGMSTKKGESESIHSFKFEV